VPRTVVKVDGRKSGGAAVGIVVRLRLALQDRDTMSALVALAVFIKAVLPEGDAEDVLRKLRMEWKKLEVERAKLAQEGGAE
jgi:hypothetical protein